MYHYDHAENFFVQIPNINGGKGYFHEGHTQYKISLYNFY
jgi:hypothetical protein